MTLEQIIEGIRPMVASSAPGRDAAGVGKELHSAAWKRPVRLLRRAVKRRKSTMNFCADDIVDDPIDVNLEAPIDDLRRELSSLEEEIEDIEAMIRGLKEKCEDYRRILDEVQKEIVERELKEELEELNVV